MKSLILISLVIPLLLTACSPSSDSKVQEPQKKSYEGDIFEKAQQIYKEENSDSFYDCDKNLISKIFKITQALEDKREKIIELNKKNLSTLDASKIRRYKIGPHDFHDFIQNEEPKDEWIQDPYGWEKANTVYERIANDSENKDWVFLNGYVRSLIVDDQSRIENMEHHNVQRLLKTTILDTYEVIKKCDENESCTLPLFTDTSLSWLLSDITYKYIYNGLLNSTDYSLKRKRIKWLKTGVEIAVRGRFGFEKNESITIVNNKITLPLNLDIFTDGIKQVKDLIETSWSKFNISIQVVPTSNIDQVFRILISNTPQERAFVSYKKKYMQLYSPTSSGTLLHETGHILGIKDRYYTWFKSSTCEYVNEFNNADIMSNGNTGKVLPSHIEEIKKAYLN